MNEHNKQKKSIWGTWWAPHRVWFYPVWLIYEVSTRFYDYSKGVHGYFEKHQGDIAPYIGKIGSQVLDVLCSSVTFVGCSVFLTVPACFVLYKFFDEYNLTDTIFEEKIKVLF